MARLLRRSRHTLDIWPGFVDALANLVMIITFLLLIFVLSQFYLSETLSGRDAALERLNREVTELANLLSLEKAANADLQSTVSDLSAELQSTLAERDRLAAIQGSAEAAIAQRDSDLAQEREISEAAKAELALVNRQLAELRDQIAALNEALEASEARDREQKAQIVDLGQRLNAALASKVQELARYRSEFFGRLRDVLGERPDIRIVGDRFVFQSEVLFASAEAELGTRGKEQLAALARTLIDISARIPPDINWVLQVDGHTDKVPIHNAEFSSNWELSTARALSVVRFLQAQGIPPEHLAATGYAEYQPLELDDSPDSYSRNRRIELKLTQR